VAINSMNLIELVINPALNWLGMGSPNAVQLVAATIAHESDMGTYLAQHGGPALGIAQIEPKTHDDICVNFLNYNPVIKSRFSSFCGVTPEEGGYSNLTFNLKYAAAMCRLAYYRHPEALPNYGDMEGMAQYWKQYYNTPQGAGTLDQFIVSWQKYITPYYLSIHS
jgi:hypothetical protein